MKFPLTLVCCVLAGLHSTFGDNLADYSTKTPCEKYDGYCSDCVKLDHCGFCASNNECLPLKYHPTSYCHDWQVFYCDTYEPTPDFAPTTPTTSTTGTTPSNSDETCDPDSDCLECVNSPAGCVFCEGVYKCVNDHECGGNNYAIAYADECPSYTFQDRCNYYDNCVECTTNSCTYCQGTGECVAPNEYCEAEDEEVGYPYQCASYSPPTLSNSCKVRGTCSYCLSEDGCAWCPSMSHGGQDEGSCVVAHEANGYCYGQPVFSNAYCESFDPPEAPCDTNFNCGACTEDEACAWCTDVGGSTGVRGSCVRTSDTPKCYGDVIDATYECPSDTFNHPQSTSFTCAQAHDCGSCTGAYGCMWCPEERVCVLHNDVDTCLTDTTITTFGEC